MTKWSLKYEMCIRCRTKTRPHRAHGLCARCYYRENEKKYKPTKGIITRRLRIKPTKELLIHEYIYEQKSIGDIAKELNYSRGRISQLLKKYEIKTRSLSEARDNAIEKEKIKIKKINQSGQHEIVIHKKVKYNINFFKKWSPEMAYVLGVIYTDGSLSRSQQRLMDGSIKKTAGRLSITQKEPELLYKTINLMEANVRISHSKRRKYKTTTAGAVYYFQLTSEELYQDLHKYGLYANKSNTIEFPSMPDDCLRHFIRGCWDGDGSFYIEKRANKIRGDYISGSRAFIEGLVDALKKNGFKKFTIHKKPYAKSPSYYLKINHKDCLKLFDYFYSNVSSEMYLERKKHVISNYLHKEQQLH